jgi:hypothetical protein
MNFAWSGSGRVVLCGVLLCAGCFSLPKAEEEKKEEPAPLPAPTVVKPRRPSGSLTPEMINETNAAQMAKRLEDELNHDDPAATPPP